MARRRHLEIDSADPFERGRQRGAQISCELASSLPIYHALFEVAARDAGTDPVDVAAIAHACLDAVAAWSPDLLRELEGVAAGADLSLTTVMTLNARTEVLAQAGPASTTECSTLVQLLGAGGSAVAAQTWDWHEELAAGWHLQTVRGDEQAFVGLCEFGMLAKIGVNSAGLGTHFNLLRHESDSVEGDGGDVTWRGGVPVHLLARAVLGRSTNVAEAVELIASAPVAASTVITVVTPGDAACVEISPAGIARVDPVDGWLVHTNHFHDQRLAAGEAVTRSLTTTFEREEILRSRLASVEGPLEAEELTALLCTHDADGAAVCRHPEPAAELGYRSATLATVAMDTARCQVLVSDNGPCERIDVTTLTARA